MSSHVSLVSVFFPLLVNARRDARVKESKGWIWQHELPKWCWVGEGLDVKIWGKNLDPEPALAQWPTDQMSLWFPERIHEICILEKLYLMLAGHELYVDQNWVFRILCSLFWVLHVFWITLPSPQSTAVKKCCLQRSRNISFRTRLTFFFHQPGTMPDSYPFRTQTSQ